MSGLKVVFRTDAGSQIGTGHFMRCLTLADALQQRGSQIRFISRNLPVYLRDMLAAKNLEYIALGGDTTISSIDELAHAHWLGTSQAQDAQATIQALSGQSWDWLVVDHYALDKRWESALRGITLKIMVIDDIADRQHDCDVLLDQNFYVDMQTRYAAKVPAHCQLLLGPRFAMLREEFRKLRERVKIRTGQIKRILIFFGGVDVDNYTGLAIKAVGELKIKGLHVDVVIGAQHPCLEVIKVVCEQHGFDCYVQTNKIAELMADADLAIGAAGAASWERCCMGLPCIAGAVAWNQVQAAQDLASIGVVKYVGAAHEITFEKLKQEIEPVLQQNWLNNASAFCLDLVDAEGVWRVIEMMERK